MDENETRIERKKDKEVKTWKAARLTLTENGKRRSNLGSQNSRVASECSIYVHHKYFTEAQCIKKRKQSHNGRVRDLKWELNGAFAINYRLRNCEFHLLLSFYILWWLSCIEQRQQQEAKLWLNWKAISRPLFSTDHAITLIDMMSTAKWLFTFTDQGALSELEQQERKNRLLGEEGTSCYHQSWVWYSM